MMHRLTALLLLASLAPAAPKVIAHRGGASLRPENTIAAFRHALKLGADVIEFDMNLTADNRIVIHHDSEVNSRICSPPAGSKLKPGPIRQLTLNQIRQFDCGSALRPGSPRFQPVSGARMPTLEEFLEAMRGSKAMLLGETKMPSDQSVPPDVFADNIYKIIKKYGVEDSFILQSGDYRAIDELHKRNPAIRTCILNARRYKPAYLETARRHRATHIMLRHDDTDAEGVRKLRDAGLIVFSGTSNDPTEWPRYVQMGFDGILTDDPEALLQFLRK